MSLSSTPNTILAVATGPSDHIQLPVGDHLLLATSGTWGAANLQVGDGATFVDCKDEAAAKVAFTEDDSIVVPGGLSYRLRVTALTANITLKAVRVPTKG